MNVATLSLLTVFDVAANLYESDNKYIQCFGALGFGQALSPSYLYELDNERRVFCLYESDNRCRILELDLYESSGK